MDFLDFFSLYIRLELIVDVNKRAFKTRNLTASPL